MMDASPEQIRAERGLLTVTLLDALVERSLGEIAVLCIVGRCRTGKTWAARDWTAAWNARPEGQLQNAAYIDCRAVALGGQTVIACKDAQTPVRAGKYPQRALDGVDVVVVDEPQVDPVLVHQLVARTAPGPAASAHRLLVLLQQSTYHLAFFGLPIRSTRAYGVDGLPVRLV